MLNLKIARILPLALILVLGGAGLAGAQGVDVYFGGGTAWNSAGTTKNATAVCPSGNLFDDFTGNCEPGPTIGGAFGVFGADYMFKPQLGFNGEYAFRFAQAPYLPDAGLNMRPAFYDFNVVWEPTAGSNSRVVPVLEGGIGAAKVALYETQTTCITGICNNSSVNIGLNANHFQVHAAAGAKLYVKGDLFVKPQFDFHYVTNLTDQFGHNWVPQVSLSIGYSFGRH